MQMQQVACALQYSQMQKHIEKVKATVLVTGGLGDSHGRGPALLLSALISLKVIHQGKGWAPALHRLPHPPCMPLASLGHCWHCHNGTPAPAGVGVPVSEQDSYVPHSLPLKYGQSFQVLP